MSRPDGRSTASRRQSGLGSDVICQEWGAESGDRSAFVRDARIPVKVIGNAGDRGGVRLASGAASGNRWAQPGADIVHGGDADDAVGWAAAEETDEIHCCRVSPFAALPGVGRYAADQVPERVTALLLDHLADRPV
jgi:hypothetical protein